MDGLHPQMKQILDMLARENEGCPHLWEMTLAEARQGKEENDARQERWRARGTSDPRP